MYVSYGTTGNRVAVINAATCNAEDTSGCGQTPAVVKVGQGTFALAVSAATDTIYAPSGADNTVAVINGATCNGTDHSGCGHLAATAKVGIDPFGAAVNDHTHTVYVTNNADGDSPGTVSVINAATCNGTNHHRLPPALPHRGHRQLTAAHRRGHPHRHPLHHRLLQRRGDHPERKTLQRRRSPAAAPRPRASRRSAPAHSGLPSTRAPAPSTSANGYLPGSMSIFKATRR